MVVLMIAGLAAARLSLISLRAVGSARLETQASALATQKMEQLRSLTWRWDYGAVLQEVSDGATDVSQQSAVGGGSGLHVSPASSLSTNTLGYVDFLDRHGQWVGTGAVPPLNAVFIRRWNVTTLPAKPSDALILRVFVTSVSDDARAGTLSASLPRGVMIASVLTRKGR